ncbi:high-affinity branched-chain amino acid transport system permease protein LivM [Treponema primitia ZAS-2]|uniref:High-affinity branched-chain amino acid transport system permease protein LivM n=1 Tax=Treponema primitia (strain ATCC BAA-887 / DSM 12427 / ZAS-2) TaxID=545694 RepID=F5YH81_TREPZ|nr:branched-chain amino acid ABC transporter permease [Treponema primitia]AEF83787.1 high-affinity branched-chain amino acid transport system permease protein LivM [Treponema primitia ZAS-2]
MKERTKNTLIPGIFAAALVCVPTLLIRINLIDAYTAQILTMGGVNALLAISVNTITGITGQLSLGQAGFMVIGAYSCIALTLDLHIPMGLSAVLAALITAFFGLIIGFPTLKLTGDYLAIVTLGFGEIIRVILTNMRSLTGGANGRRFTTIMTSRGDLAFLGVTASLALILILLQNFLRSSYGRVIMAVREDEVAANSNGVSVFRYKMVGFVIASFIAGIGGSLYAMVIGFVKPDAASFNRSIDYLIFVVLGGMGSMTGSVIAAYILTYLQEFLRFLRDYRLLIYPLILIFVMLFRPQGLLGMKELSFVRLVSRFAAFLRAKIGKGGAHAK